MSAGTPSITETIRQRLALNKSPVLPLDASELDQLVGDIYQLGTHQLLVEKLARHFGVGSSQLRDLIVARQAILLNEMTDYTKKGSPDQIESLLRDQFSAIQAMLDEYHKIAGDLAQVIETAKALNERTQVVLLSYRDQKPK